METSSIHNRLHGHDPWDHGASVAREKLFEHAFLADLTRALLLAGRRCDVLRSEFDGSGHDLVFEADGVVRHVQLKAMRSDGKRAHVGVSLELAAKPSGCVIWMLVDPDTLQITGYRWFGAAPGEPLPPLGDQVVRHAKANSQGEKAVRPGQRMVVKGQFLPVPDMAALIERLFGDDLARDHLLLRRHLRTQPPVPAIAPAWLAQVQAGSFDAMPEQLDEDGLLDLAHLVDGYALTGLEGPAGANAVVAGVIDDLTMGRAPLPSRLWAAMFLEHRRLRFEGRDATPDQAASLADLGRQLRHSLTAGRRSPSVSPSSP